MVSYFERFTDSTEAPTKATAASVPLDALRRSTPLPTGGLEPDVTFLLDLDPSRAALSDGAGRRGSDGG